MYFSVASWLMYWAVVLYNKLRKKKKNEKKQYYDVYF